MKHRRIGQTELEVTEISFGGAALGGLYHAVERETAMDVLGAAWDAGIRYFDTAPFYGFGLSERRVGDFLRDKPQGDYVLSTKVGRILSPVPLNEVPDHGYVEPLPFRVDYDYTYDGIMRSFEFSLARLGLNRIDILFVHDIGVYTHGEEATKRHLADFFGSGLKALERLKSEGAISAYGLGVNEVPICLSVMERAPIDCILLAGRYTLLDRAAERELLPLCEKTGTSLVIGGVFNSGILATGPVPGAHFDYGPASPDILDRVGQLQAIARSKDHDLAAAALQFPLHQKVVSTVLIGTAKHSSLTRNLTLFDAPIPAQSFDDYLAPAINR